MSFLVTTSHNSFLKNNKASTSLHPRRGHPFRVCFADCCHLPQFKRTTRQALCFSTGEGFLSGCALQISGLLNQLVKVAALLLINRLPVLGILSRLSKDLSRFRFGGNLLCLEVVCQASSPFGSRHCLSSRGLCFGTGSIPRKVVASAPYLEGYL